GRRRADDLHWAPVAPRRPRSSRRRARRRRMPLLLVALVVVLAAGGGVATALYVVPRASQALEAVTASTVYADADEELAESGTSPGDEGDAEPELVEPEIPVGEDEGPEPPDPEEALERAPAVEPNEPRKVPTNPELRLDQVEIEIVEGTRPWVIHRLTPLETLDQVAYRHDVTPEALRTWNGLAPGAQGPGPGTRVKL